jgi:hypothetical protein
MLEWRKIFEAEDDMCPFLTGLEISLPDADDVALKKKRKENDSGPLIFLHGLVKHTALCRMEPSSTTEYPTIQAISRAFPRISSGIFLNSA